MSHGQGRQTDDYEKFGAPFNLMWSAVVLSGTNAAAIQTAANIYRVPFNCKIVGGTTYYTTGGTAALTAPNPTIQVSLAGTGSYTAIGTGVMGTDATTGSVAWTVSSGTAALLTAGDLVVLGLGIGTAAAGKVGNVLATFIDMP